MHRANRPPRNARRRLRAALALGALAAAVGGPSLALAACGAGTSSATAPGSTVPGASNPALMAMSHCMRTHGVTNFPDPIQGSGGEGLPLAETSSGATIVEGITFSGPAFRSAAKACRLGPGGGGHGGLSEAQKQGMIANAHCMRAHGVPSFPDPTFGPHGGVIGGSGSGVDSTSPAFERANRDCENVGTPIPGGG